MTDRDDRERESAASDETRWEAAGEAEARRRHEAAERLKDEKAERLKDEDAMRYPEHDDPDEERKRAGLGGDAPSLRTPLEPPPPPG